MNRIISRFFYAFANEEIYRVILFQSMAFSYTDVQSSTLCLKTSVKVTIGYDFYQENIKSLNMKF